MEAWMRVSEGRPAKHRKYLVRRGDIVCVCTPCYGMHAPWWVPTSGLVGQESEPVTMLDTDEWKPVN